MSSGKYLHIKDFSEIDTFPDNTILDYSFITVSGGGCMKN
jgi:hypothetical protein